MNADELALLSRYFRKTFDNPKLQVELATKLMEIMTLEMELKQKYGITTQHTFVQVDADGNEVAKWTGSLTADEIAEQTA